MRFRIVFDSRIVDKGFHTRMDKLLKEAGYSWYSSGTDFNTNMRTLCYETNSPEPKQVQCPTCGNLKGG